MFVYVLEVADDKWEIHGVYKDEDTAELIGQKIVDSVVNNYEHYVVTAYPLLV